MRTTSTVALWVLALALMAGLVRLATLEDPRPAIAVIGLLTLGIFLPTWRLWVALAGVTLPFSAPLVISGGGVGAALADVFAMVAIVSFTVANRASVGDRPLGDAIKAISAPLSFAAVYLAVAAAQTLTLHYSLESVASLLQRVELIVVWLLLGALAFRADRGRVFLGGFMVGAFVLAGAWFTAIGTAGALGVQKNPSGSVIVVAILIVLTRWKSAWRLPALIFLAGALLATGSRGSIVSLAVAGVVVLLLSRSMKTLVVGILGLSAAAWAGWSVLPGEQRARLLSESADGRYNADIRDVFVQDALNQWRAHPWTGVGVGRYRQQLSELQRVLTLDPHNVYALTLAEGGWPLFAAFLVMAGGQLIWLGLRRRADSMVVLALGAGVATFVHSYVDVFWVRGTPAMFWVLAGMAGAAIAISRAPGPEGAALSARRTAVLRSA